MIISLPKPLVIAAELLVYIPFHFWRMVYNYSVGREFFRGSEHENKPHLDGGWGRKNYFWRAETCIVSNDMIGCKISINISRSHTSFVFKEKLRNIEVNLNEEIRFLTESIFFNNKIPLKVNIIFGMWRG